MRMEKNRVALIAILVVSIAACSTTRNPAPIVERPLTGSKLPESGKPGEGRPIVKSVIGSHGYYVVKKGDTLLHIALEFGQNYHDIIAWNNLSNPNDIKVDQVLRVLPPESGLAGTQTGSVTSPSTVDVRPLPATSSAPIIVPAKTAPRGDKRIYSETVLAELQKPDTVTTVTPVASPASKPEHVKPTADAKVVEKSAEVLNAPTTEDEGLSWIWPADGKVVGTFDDGKKGIDIAGKIGQQVVAAGPGKVMYAGSGIRGYGNLVILKHTSSLLSAYAHNKTILVKEGQTVSKGQKIAEMGSSDTDAVKLHFEIRLQGKPVDPSKFLPNR